MKLLELQMLVNELAEEGYANYDVQINAMTGRMRNDCKVDIAGVQRGIDWDTHRIIIQPADTLLEADCARKRWDKEYREEVNERARRRYEELTKTG